MKLITSFLFISLISLSQLLSAQNSELETQLANAALQVQSESPNVEIMHKGAPDKLKNTSGLDIRVTIRSDKNLRCRSRARINERECHAFISVRDNNGRPDTTFSSNVSDSLKIINRRIFRSGKKVSLVIHVPAKQDSDSGAWSYNEIRWNLGEGHDLPSTHIKYFDKVENGYEIIFLYKDGLQPSEKEKNKEHKMYHIDGHFCRPDDQLC